MNHFVTLFLLASRRFFSRRNIIVMAILFVIFMYGVHKGAVESRKIWEDGSEFKKIELKIFKSIVNYEQYSERGFKVFFLPPKQGVLFPNPVPLSGLSGKVNSIFSLDINHNCRDSNVIKGNSMLKFRFSTLVIILGSLAVLFVGAAPFRDREFLKSLAKDWSPLKIFLSIILSRIILIGLTFLVILGCSLLLLKLENIAFTGSDFINILWYLIVTCLTLIFFFIIGTILGSLQDRIGLFSSILVVWLLLVFIWPGIVDSIIEDKADKITSSYKTDTQKLQTVNEFEDIAIEKYGPARINTEEGKKIVADYYIKNVFPMIEANDEKQEAEIAAVIHEYMTLSALISTTHYLLTCNELSGRGYGNYLNFSSYLRKERREFLLFWIDRVYYHDPKEMKNFVTKDENIFPTRGMKPYNFWTGCFFQILWIILLGTISYLLFKNLLVWMKTNDIKKLGKVDLKLETGKINVRLVKGIALILALYSIFSGKIKYLTRKGFKGNVVLGDMNLAAKKMPIEFAYICHPNNLPGDIKVKVLLIFYCRWYHQTQEQRGKILGSEKIKDHLNQPISKLENDVKFEIIMSLLEMTRGQVYLIDNVTSDIPPDEMVRFKHKMEELTRQGATVIYLTVPRMIELTTLEMKDYYDDGGAWLNSVISHEHSLKYRGK